MPAETVNVGWTWAATFGAAQTVLLAGLGGGGLWGIFRGVALLWKQNNESKKLENDAAAAVRREMADITERQQKRIDALEQAGRDDRKRFDEEVAAVRRLHVEEVTEMRLRYEAEIRSLRDEIAGYHRQLVQFQQSSGASISLAAKAPTAATRAIKNSGIDDVLKMAFDIPAVDNGTDG